MAHIYSGSRLCPGLGLGVQAIASRDLSLHAHTALQISGHCFRGLIIMRPTQHFRDQATAFGDLSLRAPHNTSEVSIIINMTSYQYPSVSPIPV